MYPYTIDDYKEVLEGVDHAFSTPPTCRYESVSSSRFSSNRVGRVSDYFAFLSLKTGVFVRVK